MTSRREAVEELAYAKLNLVLHVGPPQPNGLHAICSIFASLELADDVHVQPGDGPDDRVECEGVEGPNLAAAALTAFRAEVPSLPPLDVAELRAIAATLGSDVPSQVEPGHALVAGTGGAVEAIPLPPLAAVLVPQAEGLATAEVYAQLDRMEGWREQLDGEAVRATLDSGPSSWELAFENDLQPAALALRPELVAVIDRLRAAGALVARVSGSGPTCFGLFADRSAAAATAEAMPGALVTSLRLR